MGERGVSTRRWRVGKEGEGKQDEREIWWQDESAEWVRREQDESYQL